MTTFIQAITLTVSIVIMVLVAKWQVNNDIKKMQKRLDKETNNKEKTMSKDITEDILLRAGFKKTSNSLFVLRRADYAIELLNLHFDADECKRHWTCDANTNKDYTITRTSIQTVEHFNKLMELMDIDFRLKEE